MTGGQAPESGAAAVDWCRSPAFGVVVPPGTEVRLFCAPKRSAWLAIVSVTMGADDYISLGLDEPGRP